MLNYDIDKIKNISIVDFLTKNGHKRQRGSGKFVSFYSPLSPEGNASFKVNTQKNTWKCYHEGKWGSIIDLVMEIERCDFKQACAILSDGDSVEIEDFVPVKQESGVKIHSVDVITNKELLTYFTEKRCVDETVLRTYCSQVSFSFPFSDKDTEKVYTAIGFPTAMKSWELRNTFMKIASPPKSFTHIKGFSKDKLMIFEGWIDFTSYLTHHKIITPKYDCYVLNGVHQLRLIKPFLKGKDCYVYVDSDDAGDGVIANMDNCNPIDMRYTFPFFNDYNEYLQNRFK